MSAIKKKHGNRLIVGGGWNGRDEHTNVSEEVVNKSVYRSFEMLVPGSDYAFAGGFLGTLDDEETTRKNQWVIEAAGEGSLSFYKT